MTASEKTIASIIKDLVATKKCNYRDIVILYRINRQYIPFKNYFF